MSQSSNGADHQAELEQRLERYLGGDRYALDGFDEPEEVQQSNTPKVDPDDFNTEDGFVHACVADLIAGGGIGRGEASARQLVKDLDGADEENTRAQNQLVEGIGKIRDNMRKEMVDWIARKDREFTAEVTMLRGNMLTKCSDDLNAMRNDLAGVLRREIADELRTELADEFVKMVEEVRKQMRAELSAKIKMFRSVFKKDRRH